MKKLVCECGWKLPLIFISHGEAIARCPECDTVLDKSKRELQEEIAKDIKNPGFVDTCQCGWGVPAQVSIQPAESIAETIMVQCPVCGAWIVFGEATEITKMKKESAH